MKNLWNIPVLSVYFYAVTILTQFGYNSYFGIPSSFIDASIKENIIYFFQLFQVASRVAGLMRWWVWVLVILAVSIVLYLSSYKYKTVISAFSVVFLGLLLWSSYGFGGRLAESTTSFYTLAPNCTPMREDKSYVIPSFYDGKAILIPIDQNNKKMAGGFLIRNVSDLPCELEQKEIGKITK